MAEIKFQLDYDYFNEKCSYEELKQATSILSMSNEEEFNTIRNNEWFNTLYNTIVFSSNNEKRITPYIQTLSQAQQLLIEILFRLSEHNLKINSLLMEYYPKIEILSQQNVKLSEQIKNFQNHTLLGIGKNSTINNLTEREQIILSGIIYNLAFNSDDIPSDNQTEYAHILFNKLGIEEKEINPSATIESIKNIDSKKLILTCCMEYLFLFNNDISYLDKFNTLYETFDFGLKTINEIKNKINEMYATLGVQGFLDKYKEMDIVNEDIFILDIDETLAINESKCDEETPLEEIIIDQIMYIGKDEEIIISNKAVHIISYINCQGRLTFENCYISYNEQDISQQIVLSEGATLTFQNCGILDNNKTKRYFIEAQKGSKVEVYDCVLLDCAYFIKGDNTNTLLFGGCEITDPSEYFIYGSTESGGIIECEINFTRNIYKAFPEAEENTTVIYLSQSDENQSFIVKDTSITGKDDYLEEYAKASIFWIHDGIYENCTFQHLYSICVVAYQRINNCNFIDCIYPISAAQYSTISTTITNCNFTDCVGAIYINEWGRIESFSGNKNYTISNCSFDKCNGELLATSKLTESTYIDLSFCEFDNCELNEDDRGLFYLDSSTSYGKITINKCVFNNINLKNKFFASTKIYINPYSLLIRICDCTFKNCKTSNLKGLFNEYSEYTTIFGNLKSVKVMSIENCKNIHE